MALLTTLWSLLPIPIGIVCLLFAWRIPSQDNEATDTKQKSDKKDIELEEYFSEDTDRLLYQEMDKKREKYFIILFTGLGIGSILLGMETFSPSLNVAAKTVFFLTLTLSIAVHYIENKSGKDNESPDETRDD